MGKAKLRPIAAIMKIIESVPGDAREELEADLRDLLRPAPKPRSKPKPERKPSQKRKAGKEAAAANDSECQVEGCGIPLIADRHHNKQNPHYHKFQPAGEAKGANV